MSERVQIPEYIKHLKHLSKLDISKNEIPELCAEIGHLTELVHLALSKNLYPTPPPPHFLSPPTPSATPPPPPPIPIHIPI